MILKFHKHIFNNESIDQTGNLFLIEEDIYEDLLRRKHVVIPVSDHVEGTGKISTLALVYDYSFDFPNDFMNDKDVIRKFIEHTAVCIVESSEKDIKLSYIKNLSGYISSIQILFNDLPYYPNPGLLEKREIEPLDIRALNFLQYKAEYTGQICGGCGWIDPVDKFICRDFYCYSDYALVEDGICKVYFGGSTYMYFFYLFPFRTIGWDKEADYISQS